MFSDRVGRRQAAAPQAITLVGLANATRPGSSVSSLAEGGQLTPIGATLSAGSSNDVSAVGPASCKLHATPPASEFGNGMSRPSRPQKGDCRIALTE